MLPNKDRRKAREHAALMLYQYGMGSFPPEDIISLYREEVSEESSEILNLADKLFKSAVENMKIADMEISKALKKGWTLDRLLPLDRAILRLATSEILNGSISPVPAIINDAVEIAKEYGEDEKSPRFINAILDRISKER